MALSRRRDCLYNNEEGSLRFYLKGRPIVVYAPTPVVDNFSVSRVNPGPEAKLKMHWVFGYRGKDCRSNLYLLPTGEIVYFIAAVVVLHDVEQETQRHYLGHTDDVKCIAVHPNKLLVASGQTAGHDRKNSKPHVRIWNSVSLQTLHVLGLGDFERSISCLTFSITDGGNILVVVDESAERLLSVWDWSRNEKGHKITETKCSSDLVVAVEFHPTERCSFVTCGKGHIGLWTFEGRSLARRLGQFDGVLHDKPKYITCLCFAENGDILTGDSSGNITVWARGNLALQTIVRNAHEGPVFSILALKDGTFISGGGKDGQIRFWDSTYSSTDELAIPKEYGQVRTLLMGKSGQIIVGTTKNCILSKKTDSDFAPLVHGHTDEVWALCAHPNQNYFLSGGHDRLLRMWKSETRTIAWTVETEDPVQSACFSPDGFLAAVGTTTGKWLTLDSETGTVRCSHTDGTEAIQVVNFSPDGKYLAVASRDNNIYVYSVGEDYKFTRIGRCTGHSSFVTHLDWSMDSTYFRTNSGDYELLFWNAGVCRQIPQSSQMRDVDWASQSCTVTFDTVGIWPENADGTDVNACDRSNDRQLLATADDFGQVKLFSCPASQPKSVSQVYSGHSSHVTSVKFLHDDSFLISAGGKDTALIQWSVQ